MIGYDDSFWLVAVLPVPLTKVRMSSAGFRVLQGQIEAVSKGNDTTSVGA
jgi:hypothetical protein